MTGRTAQNRSVIPFEAVGPLVENGDGSHRGRVNAIRVPQITGSV